MDIQQNRDFLWSYYLNSGCRNCIQKTFTYDRYLCTGYRSPGRCPACIDVCTCYWCREVLKTIKKLFVDSIWSYSCWNHSILVVSMTPGVLTISWANQFQKFCWLWYRLLIFRSFNAWIFVDFYMTCFSLSHSALQFPWTFI